MVRSSHTSYRKLSTPELKIVLESLGELLDSVPDDFQDDDLVVSARGRVEQTLQWLEQEPDAASDDNPFESDGDIFSTSGRSEAEGAEAVNGAPPSLARSMGEWLARFWTWVTLHTPAWYCNSDANIHVVLQRQYHRPRGSQAVGCVVHGVHTFPF